MSGTAPPPAAIRERRPGQPGPRGGRSRAAAYLVVRLSGVILAVLVLGHFALTHVINDVADTGSAFVARRWGSALWLAWDWTMLGAAFVHGGAGVWIVIDDHTPDRARRRRRHALLTVACTVLWALGSVSIAAAIIG